MKEIIFKKSLLQRLKEYNDIFNTFLFTYPLKKKWRSYMELTICLQGWMALWKIPRLTCEEFSIVFPTVVVVNVVSVDLQTLTALVKVASVQIDDRSFCLPVMNCVSLIELWPTEEQDSKIDDIKSTANALDVYRFFYLYLYFPWDDEEDDDSDWRGKHLESRLTFYYVIKSGTIPRFAAHRIQSLIDEARSLQKEKEILAYEVDVAEDRELEGKTLHTSKI